MDGPPLRQREHAPSQFYTLAKTCRRSCGSRSSRCCSIVVYSTMIVGLPIVLGFCRRLWTRGRAGTRNRPAGRDDLRGVRAGDAQEHRRRDAGRSARALLLAGLRADVAGGGRGRDRLVGVAAGSSGRVVPWLAAVYCALVWADPTWAYDASWLVKRYQLHWPALREAGEWIEAHPDRVPRRPGS